MIGNDVIDLQIAAKENNWQRRGFEDKVFMNGEKKLILNSVNPFQTVWLLWSMKESAYKAYLQHCPKRFFNPKKLECSLIDHYRGIVRIDGLQYKTYSNVTQNCIHTVAIKDENVPLASACFTLSDHNYQTQHMETQKKLILELTQIKKLNLDAVEVKKNKAGVPKIFQNTIQLDISFSLSHHGKYGSYAILN